MTKQKFEVVVESEHGRRPIEDFKAHLADLKSEALIRFGGEIRFKEIGESDQNVSTEDFE